MEGTDSVGWFAALITWIAALARDGVWQLLTVQNVISLVSTSIAVWKWWEARESNLFFRFERMIARNEHKLVGARTDLLDVMNRPGPGVLVRAPLFMTWKLRAVLQRRKWHPSSLWPIGQTVDRRLRRALRTCDRKVSAHLGRLSHFREQIASVHLIRGALAAGRAVVVQEEHKRQLLEQEALDQFRLVLAIPGHQDDLAAREFIAHQLARTDQRQLADSEYCRLIELLKPQPAAPTRNLVLSRAKRCLAVLRYPSAPLYARGLLAEAAELMTQFGPPRDRDFLELAETYYLDGITRLRLGAYVQGAQQLGLAQGCYRGLVRSLRERRRGLFNWMLSERRFSGHRVKELCCRAEYGLDQVNRVIKLNENRRDLLIASLRKGSGVPRRNRKPPC
jgi:hypothetical protein